MITRDEFLSSTGGNWGNRYASFVVANTTADDVVKALNRIDPRMYAVDGIEHDDGSVSFNVAKASASMIYKLTEKLHTTGFAHEMWQDYEFAAAKNGRAYDDFTAEWTDHGPHDEYGYEDAFFSVEDNKTGMKFYTGAGAVDKDTEKAFSEIVNNHSFEITRKKEKSAQVAWQYVNKKGLEIRDDDTIGPKWNRAISVPLPVLHEHDRNDINYLAERVIMAADALDTYSVAAQVNEEARRHPEQEVWPEEIVSFVEDMNDVADELADRFKLERNENLHGMNARVCDFLEAKNVDIYNYDTRDPYHFYTFRALEHEIEMGNWKPGTTTDKMVVASLEYRREMDRESRLAKAVNNIVDIKQRHNLMTSQKKMQKAKSLTRAE